MLNMSTQEKADAFDLIQKHFLNKNFGSANKGDIELLLFSIIIDHLIDHEMDYDDYTLSNMLGITQQRVSNLKIKKQLRYPKEYNWKKALISRLPTVVYSKNDTMVSLMVNDPNLHIEVKHFLESKGYFYDYNLNPKNLTMDTCAFARLLLEIGEIDTYGDAWKILRQKCMSNDAINHDITKETITAMVRTGTKDLLKVFVKDFIATII